MPASPSDPPSRLLLLLKLLLLLCVAGVLLLGASPLYEAAQRLLGATPPARVPLPPAAPHALWQPPSLPSALRPLSLPHPRAAGLQ